ncbi:hypothetical protein FHS09_002975 [Microbulbifer rhizosphaerae]|uniref:Uncharacterized protein n=1 Tax=Microbulbifer rhizosphaerae TaxID=1562603 RepID=A0A7W4WDB0_9GAMM|nr:hypothetical protein [Microbulbifer rhizosphaerae]
MAIPYKLRVISLRDQLLLIQYGNVIGMRNRRQPMGDSGGGAPFYTSCLVSNDAETVLRP